jgi:hypothetical protein
MKGLLQRTAVAAIAMIAIACLDTTSPSNSVLSLTDALVTLPAGFTSTNNTFAPTNGTESAFMPPRGNQGPGGVGMMGGGLGPDFDGGIGFGRRFGEGPFGQGGPFGHGDEAGDCSFSSATGRVTCTKTTGRGLTIVSSTLYTKADGTVQSSPDSTTNTVNAKIQATGTVTRRDSAVSVVNNSSERTITGLAVGSTQRTVNGTSRGEESTTGTNADGPFTAARLVGDTTSGLVIPVVSGKPTYPTAGTVIRSMNATVTIQGQSPTTKSRREVITYDGSATATIVITQDGTTKTCSLPLPRGMPTCQ